MIELILSDRCTACGACELVCPTNVFDVDASGRPSIARQEECHTCFLCEAHCPADALFVGPLRHPQPVTREEVLALGVLGNFRKALGFDQHEPGSYCYTGPILEKLPAYPEAGARKSGGPDAAIYAALAVANARGLVDVNNRRPIEKEVIA